MKTVWIFSNAVAVTSTLVCVSYLYYATRTIRRKKLPLYSILVIGVTVIVSGLQFLYPEVLGWFQRTPGAVRAGELWRLVTALFIQPNGIGQCLANEFLMIVFLPSSERLHGRHILTIYLASGIAGQIVNHLWNSGLGGSSTAIFGIMGSLLVYIIRKRKVLLIPFSFIASLGLFSSIIMLISRDGHGIGLIVGAAISWHLPLNGVIFRSRESNGFTESSNDLPPKFP